MASRTFAALSPREAPVQARSASTVDAVLDGTIQVLLSGAPDRLTTTRVARRAGVSVGTLYQYFPNKQALLYAVLDRHLAKLAEALEAACAARRGHSVEVMAAAVVQGYLQAKAEQCAVSRALYMIAFEFDGGALVEAATRRGEQAMAAMLLTAADGAFADPQRVAQTLLAAVSGAVRAVYERGLPPATAAGVANEFTLMCRAYLAAAGESDRLAA